MSDSRSVIRTLRVRVKDKHSKVLDRMAFECNQVWNMANELSYDAWRIPVPEVGWINGVWLHAFEIQKSLAGINRVNDWFIRSVTVQEVIAVHAKTRNQFKKSKLKWRVSGGPRKNLGWIPFKSRAARFEGGKIRFSGHSFGVWDSYGLDKYKFRSGNFSQDSRGRWYFNIHVEINVLEKSAGTSSVGVDLGVKDLAVCSDGSRLKASRHYRALEMDLASAQRARKKNRVRAIHAKIKNRRKDDIHKFTNYLVSGNAAIFVGDVSSSKLAKTNMAKSVMDSGWGILKSQLQYKAIARGVWFMEVSESYTTQSCSCCGAISGSSPKGRAGLGIREWTCLACGTRHDRDINAAKNILALGHQRLAGGSSALEAAADVNTP